MAMKPGGGGNDQQSWQRLYFGNQAMAP